LAAIHGILLLDKPLGLSSNHAVRRAQRALGADKAGHTGALDPLATGMLPLVFGEATKIAGHLLGSRKAYAAEVRLGVSTTTDDAEGEVIATAPADAVADAALAQALARFVGRIRQRPPVYSALKQGGVPLYRRARRGEAVEVPEREVVVESAVIRSREGDRVSMEITCGSGTYIRSIARDLGEALGCGAHLAGLRRLWVEPFQGAPMVALDDVAGATLLTLEAALADWPRIDLDADETTAIRHGKTLNRGPADWFGRCRLYAADGVLIALGERSDNGSIRVRRGLNLT
jgi:tRNA pseudouridine55 synthase